MVRARGSVCAGRTCQDEQRREPSSVAKLDVRVQAIADHDRPLGVKLIPAPLASAHTDIEGRSVRDTLRLDAVHHRLRRLPDAERLPAECGRERRADRPRTGEEPVRARVRAVNVSCEERAGRVPPEVRERLGELRVVDGGVEPAEDGADVGVGLEVLQVELAERVVRGVLCAVGGCRYTVSARGLTVPPRCWMPSSSSSSSRPFMPTT